MTPFAPVPEFARGPELPDGGYRVTDLGDGVHGITSGMVNTMFVVTRGGVVLLDAPLDLGENLLAGIGEVTGKAVTHLIYSHAHSDHIGYAHALAGDGVEIIAHELTAQLLADAADPRRPLPTRTVSGSSSELTLGGVRFVLDHTGTWHLPGNLFVHLPQQKVLAAIDSFTVRNAPFFRLLFAPYVPAYFRAMDQILTYDFDTVVSGHMALFGTQEDVVTNREYLRDLHRAASQAFGEVNLREAAAAAGVPHTNRQGELKVWMDAVVARAGELMPASWGERLGGTDIFLTDNLNAVAWSIAND
jgi:glyoxylase-like metal-dependent hydrolase (beta-lactamase superfamily II)